MKSSSGSKPETILGKLGHVQKYDEYEEMDNEEEGQAKNTDDNDENSIHADIGGMYTERKLGLINDTEAELHPEDANGDD